MREQKRKEEIYVMKRRLFLCVALLFLAGALTACGSPNGSFLKKELSGSADFYALFDPYVDVNVSKYKISDVDIAYSHEENKGHMDITAAVTCKSDKATYAGTFEFQLNKYDSGWDIDEMKLIDGSFIRVSNITEDDVSTLLDSELLSDENKVMATLSSSVDKIAQTEGEPSAMVDMHLVIDSPVAQIGVPVQFDFLYNGTWELSEDSLATLYSIGLESMDRMELKIPMGTYLEGIRGDYVAFSVYKLNSGTEYLGNTEATAYGYCLCSYYDEYYSNTGRAEIYADVGEIYITDDYQYLNVGGELITLDANGDFASNNENIIITKYSEDTSCESVLDALISGYNEVERPIESYAINYFMVQNNLDPTRVTNYSATSSANIDMAALMSANIYGATLLQAKDEGWLDEWMFLYVNNSSDPAFSYDVCEYNEVTGKWAYYGITYEEAEAANWGDGWLEEMRSNGYTG